MNEFHTTGHGPEKTGGTGEAPVDPNPPTTETETENAEALFCGQKGCGPFTLQEIDAASPACPCGSGHNFIRHPDPSII